MAEDEIIHATFFHKIAGEELEKVNRVLAPSMEMQEEWTTAQQEFNEKTAWVKSLLSMQPTPRKVEALTRYICLKNIAYYDILEIRNRLIFCP